MIVTSSRIRTSSGSSSVGNHVFAGPKNESIEIIQGSRFELDDMVSDAQDHGAKYAIRHFKISPKEAMTRDQALIVTSSLGAEFGFDANRGVLVEHQKKRANGKGFDRHWHFMVPEVDPVKGRVLSDKWSRPRQEKIARLAEIEFGHDLVQGKWSQSVERTLRAEGKDELADKIAHLGEGERPRESYTSDTHQEGQRKGLSLPELKAVVSDAWNKSDNGKAFQAALSEHEIFIRPGDKKGAWIAEATSPKTGELVLLGSISRLTKAKSADVETRLAEIDFRALDASASDVKKKVSKQDGLTRKEVKEESSPPLPQPVDIKHISSQEDNYGRHQEAAQPALDRGNPDRDGLTGGIQEVAAHIGSQGADASGLRSDVSSSGRARPASPEIAAGPAIRPGPEQDGPGSGAAGADRAQPGEDRGNPGPTREATAADRLRARREAQGLADTVGRNTARLAALTARLAGTPDKIARQERLEIIRDALARSRKSIAYTLSKAPYADPKSRTFDELSDAERLRVQRSLDEAKDRAKTSRENLKNARAKMTILGWLGIPTKERKEVIKLTRETENAEFFAQQSEKDLQADITEADARAKSRAAYREAEQTRWENTKPVLDAHQEEHANQLIEKAVKSGDKDIEHLASTDLEKAQKEVLKKEKHLEEKRRKKMDEMLEPDIIVDFGSRSPTPAPVPRMR